MNAVSEWDLQVFSGCMIPKTRFQPQWTGVPADQTPGIFQTSHVTTFSQCQSQDHVSSCSGALDESATLMADVTCLFLVLPCMSM